MTEFRATAPYGLVPLPQQPMPAARLWPEGANRASMLQAHHTTVRGTRSGWIDLEIRTLTPLYIGGTQQEGHVNLPLRLDGHPVIPGSSLRGMLRHYLRMLTGGEVGPVNRPQLFFRAPVKLNPEDAEDDKDERWRHVLTAMNQRYNEARGRKPRQVGERRAGWLYKHEDEVWRLCPLSTTAPLKVKFRLLKEACRKFGWGRFDDPPTDNTYVPAVHHEAFQYKTVWASIDGDQARDLGRSPHEARGNRKERPVRRCVLVLTGVAGRERNSAYLFPYPSGNDSEYSVDAKLIKSFESSSQITFWQERNFDEKHVVFAETDALPDGLPRGTDARRPKPGALVRGAAEPVWFDLDDDGEVVAFGRSGGFRVAVGGDDPIGMVVPDALLTPDDPEQARRREPDVPRALFGDIDLVDDSRVAAARGRVSVGSAICPNAGAHEDPAVRVELLGPKRSAFANYLKQNSSTATALDPDLVTWSEVEHAQLGGYKIYLYRWDSDIPQPGPPSGDIGKTERDVRPWPTGLTFQGRITFRNLTESEVGALMNALLLLNPADGGDPANPKYAHKIGLGKPYGWGSVHIRPRLYFTDSSERAASLDLDAGLREADPTEAITQFRDALVEWASEGSPRPPQTWTEVKRIKSLLMASLWSARLDPCLTETMDNDQFGLYPMLPSIEERFRLAREG
ncbi:TIGR03986 family CRISPR-associated RAMP protein [Lipingzhangella sp. LS1_29]|uniref:TIGR03986 family CRISPR-associated RAMP protein n=1 Tax=Lipingzhangella rawalii TaxID=2055835 RepID=A0ABU2H772_9ACTN|nr:TIGR03986 family CRISPR-associated RAMP protein [Lipingzhangella rawalii]MDS1270690.1 TIGR03986 family CRISPR-associated RAMP protein [Lipingzhangella rawalii]